MRNSLKLIVPILLSALVAGCDMCGNEVLQSITSPSGELKVEVFSRDCGATTGFSTQVSIISADDRLPNEGGNILVLDGTVPIKVQWRSDSTLTVAGLGTSQVFKQESSLAGVSINYGK